VRLDDVVPLRWPCGPLEIERGRRSEGFTADDEAALRSWTQPGSLELLSGSAVNGLVVPWAAGSPGDAAHQAAISPLLAAARRRGLSLVGWVDDGADLRKAREAARAAGLDALATESAETLDGFEVLRFRRRGIGGPAGAPFLGDAEAVWPGMRPLALAPDVDAVSGATSRPWIDSNAWYARLAHTLLAPKVLWLAFDPPDPPVASEAYVQAIADTAVGGARWVASLDRSLRHGLVSGRGSSRESWERIARALAFFEEHRGWAAFAPVGQIGVLSDYSGANEFLSFEVLNLMSRRSSLCRVLDARATGDEALRGLDAVLYLDASPPGRDLATRLLAFAEAGGTLVTPPGWEPRGVPDEAAAFARFRVFRHGRGRLAIAREDLADPDLVAEDAQLLTSHRHDRVRAFNLGVGRFHYATSPDGHRGVLHTFAFPMTYRRGPVSAWFSHPWAEGRLARPDAAQTSPAPRSAVERGVEFQLGLVPGYSALEVGDGPGARAS
jgi:hypothetical protein